MEEVTVECGLERASICRDGSVQFERRHANVDWYQTASPGELIARIVAAARSALESSEGEAT